MLRWAHFVTMFMSRRALRIAGGAGLLGLPAAALANDPPSVTVQFPNGGESLLSSHEYTIQWVATDDEEVLAVDVLVSYDGGASWGYLVRNGYNAGTWAWFPQNRPTAAARVRVIAYDQELLTGQDTSDGPFGVVNSASGRLPTTARDFDLPGTQPMDVPEVNNPDICSSCHGYYDEEVEPFFNWKGSMMAYASIDPLFKAAMAVANYDAPESGESCLRCHTSAGWLAGQSTPTDGSQISYGRLTGVSCATCHGMVDPFYEAGVSPIEDQAVLASIAAVPGDFSNAQYVIDNVDFRYRGPFVDAVAGHEFLPSPFHREAALCGTCHDVNNPLLNRNPDGSYSLNAMDSSANVHGVNNLGIEQRTYSEWFFSAFNTPQGVYAPEFGGNRDTVRTCQDCHMRDVTGQGCVFGFAPVREDLPLHDLTGGNTFMLNVMRQVHPDPDHAALDAGIARARYMLQNAADLAASRVGDGIDVRVTNRSGHKLPTGYPEGRRIWLNVRFYDAADQLVTESGAYDAGSGELTLDPQIKVYEAILACGEDLAAQVGLPVNTIHHLMLNTVVLKDNRIPPLGFSNSHYAAFGGAPVAASYADGQNWDISHYPRPAGAVRAEVTLNYQSVSKEYAEFIRDNAGAEGATFYALWEANGRSAPEVMAVVNLHLLHGDLNCDGAVNNFDIDPFVLALSDPDGYAAALPDCDRLLADMDGDGLVTNFDIDPFVACISGGGCP